MNLQTIDARTSVLILQQPNSANGYTTIVEINDSPGGADFYEIILKGEGPSGYLTDFQDFDSDDDGFSDGMEISSGSNPINHASTPFNHGLVAWYSFDGNASDMSGNGNHGTVYGATLGTDRNGVAGKAYSFDGVNDLIEVSDGGALEITENLSVFLWYKNLDDRTLPHLGLISKSDRVPVRISGIEVTDYSTQWLVFLKGEYRGGVEIAGWILGFF